MNQISAGTIHGISNTCLDTQVIHYHETILIWGSQICELAWCETESLQNLQLRLLVVIFRHPKAHSFPHIDRISERPSSCKHFYMQPQSGKSCALPRFQDFAIFYIFSSFHLMYFMKIIS